MTINITLYYAVIITDPCDFTFQFGVRCPSYCNGQLSLTVNPTYHPGKQTTAYTTIPSIHNHTVGWWGVGKKQMQGKQGIQHVQIVDVTRDIQLLWPQKTPTENKKTSHGQHLLISDIVFELLFREKIFVKTFRCLKTYISVKNFFFKMGEICKEFVSNPALFICQNVWMMNILFEHFEQNYNLKNLNQPRMTIFLRM